MNTDRQCGCKSFRTCILCETEFELKPWFQDVYNVSDKLIFNYSPDTGDCVEDSTDKDKKRIEFPGIKIIPDFISEEEEKQLVSNLDLLPWDLSQSGRRKQNFGPRANFNKRKAKVGQNFVGFPLGTKFVQDRFSSVPLLENYRTVEQCSIEYKVESGACIEPHVDDCWIWGERIVQLNMLSPTILTCFPLESNCDKYNLNDVATYPKVIHEEKVVFNPFKNKDEKMGSFDKSEQSPFPSNSVVKIHMPPRSLLLMYGQARYGWEHAVLREDICNRRVVLAYRELTPPYLPGGREEGVGADILTQSARFW